MQTKADHTPKSSSKTAPKNAGKNARKKDAKNTGKNDTKNITKKPRKTRKDKKLKPAWPANTETGTLKAVVEAERGVLTPKTVLRMREALALRTNGATWGEIALTGTSYAEVSAITCRTDGGKAELDAAERAFKAAMAKRLESKLAERALNPKKKYVIGKKGGDSVILKHPETQEYLEVEPDNGNLLIGGLRALHPDFKEASSGGAASGAGIVYNIQIGSITNTPNNGGKMAETISAIPLSIDNQTPIATKSRGDNP